MPAHTAHGVIKNPGELLEVIKRHVFVYQPDAMASIRRNKHMNDVPASMEIDPRVVDAVLIDFLNFVGAQYGVDYAINTCDLPSPGLLDRMAQAADEKEGSRGPG